MTRGRRRLVGEMDKILINENTCSVELGEAVFFLNGCFLPLTEGLWNSCEC